MADTKITALTALTGANVADTDKVPVVDVSDTTMAASGTTKSITALELGTAIGANGRLNLGEYTTTQPASPTSGVIMFTRNRAGRRLPTWVGPSGVDCTTQPHFGQGSVSFVKPSGNGTVIASQGIVVTATGTATAANWASTNILTSVKRISYISAATAAAVGGMREAVAKYWRGNAAGLGGFYVVCRFGFATISSTANRWFCGLSSTTAALSNADPSSFLTMIGVGKDAADTNCQFMHNDGSGVATRSAGSANVAVPLVNELFEVRIFAKPNGTSVQMSVEKLNGGSVSEYDSAASADLPTNTTGLAFHLWCSNNATAVANDPHLVSLYIETDY
jgi:hypothetical protein